MRAGRLRHRVSIKVETLDYLNLDTYGQPTKTWTDVCTIWAAIEPLQGQEYHAAMRDNAEVKTRIRIRYRSDINRTMKVVYGSTEFEILDTINPKFANVELQLMCKERQ